MWHLIIGYKFTIFVILFVILFVIDFVIILFKTLLIKHSQYSASLAFPTAVALGWITTTGEVERRWASFIWFSISAG